MSIVIEVRGGVVQEVYSDTEIDVFLLDHDILEEIENLDNEELMEPYGSSPMPKDLTERIKQLKT